MFKKIISLALASVVFVSALSILVFAEDGEPEPDYTGAVSFWDSVLYSWAQRFDSGIPFFNPAQDVIGTLCQSVCAESEDSLHHAASITNDYLTDATGSYTWATCKYCNTRFKLYASDIKDSYQSQVSALPATQYGSDGAVYVTAYHTCLYFGGGSLYYCCPHRGSYDSTYRLAPGNDGSSFDCENLVFTRSLVSGSSRFIVSYVNCSFECVVPIDGRVFCPYAPTYDAYYISTSNTKIDRSGYWSGLDSSVSGNYYTAGTVLKLRTCSVPLNPGSYDYSIYAYVKFDFPVIKVVPYDYDKENVVSQYPSSGRPVFTDGKYGVVGSGGNVSLVDNTQSIINETNNTYYNPVTNQTSNVTDWTYNYDNRSYNVTTESGNTVTVTYGDKNISITENNVVEGDTITNNYTIYYVVDNGSQTPTPTPSPSPSPDIPTPIPTPGGCTHQYTITKEKEPTCTESGYKIYKCDLCGDTYTDSIKALGHDWHIVSENALSNDETPDSSPVSESTPAPESSAAPDASPPPAESGSETTDPTPTSAPTYTLYRCFRCNMEYKDFDGSGPPQNKDDEEEGGLWGWVKKLFGSIWNGLLSILETIVGGTIDLVCKLIDELVAGVNHVITGLFDSLGQIADFGGGFKDFLGSFFSFVPPEIVTLLAFSISLGIILMFIKFFRG